MLHLKCRILGKRWTSCACFECDACCSEFPSSTFTWLEISAVSHPVTQKLLVSLIYTHTGSAKPKVWKSIWSHLIEASTVCMYGGIEANWIWNFARRLGHLASGRKPISSSMFGESGKFCLRHHSRIFLKWFIESYTSPCL